MNHTIFQNLALWIFKVVVRILLNANFTLIKLSWHSCSIKNKLWWLNWFWQFLGDGLSSFNLKRFCYSYPWSYSLCEGKTSFCTGLIYRKLCGFLLMYLTGLFHSVFVPLLIPSSLSLYMVFYAIWSNIDEVLLINPSVNVFVFGEVIIHHKNLFWWNW